jgi:hypothetical protein
MLNRFIPEVLGSNPSLGTGYCTWRFSCFCLTPPYPAPGYSCISPNPFKLVSQLPFCCVASGTEATRKLLTGKIMRGKLEIEGFENNFQFRNFNGISTQTINCFYHVTETYSTKNSKTGLRIKI